MPLQYPPAPPTLSGDTLNVSRFLADSRMVFRRMMVLTEGRFVSDRVLGMPAQLASAGSIVYSPDQNPVLSTFTLPAVSPGSEYPRIELPTGTAAIGAIVKYGVTIPITDESLSRVAGLTNSGQAAGKLIDQALTTLITTMKAALDGIAMAAIDAAVSNTTATVGLWKTVASSDPVQDVTVAAAKIRKGSANSAGLFPGSGYNPDSLVCSDINSAYLASSAKIQAALARVNDAYVRGNGNGGLNLAGLDILASGMLPTPTKAFVLDSENVGFWAYERLNSPGYVGDPATGIETWARRDNDDNDQWLVTARRPVVPIIVNSSAAWAITGLTE